MEAIPQQSELDSIDWRTPMRRARQSIARHGLLILVSCVVALTLLVLYEYIFPPVYRAEVVLQAELNDDAVRTNYYAIWDVFRKGDMKSEPELVTSGRVAQEVVSSLGLHFSDVYHTFLTHLTHLWIDSWIGRKYHAFKEFIFPPSPASYRATPEQIENARTVEAFKDGVSVEPVPGTTVARVVVKAPTFRAAEFANAVVDMYLLERNKSFRTEADAAYKSLETEVESAGREIAALDQKRLDFDTRNKVVLDFEKDKLVVGNWAALQASINEVRSTIASLEASRTAIERQLAIEPVEIINERKMEESKVKSLLQAREVELSASLLATRQRYMPDSPEVTQIEKLLAETRAALQQEPKVVEVGQDRIVNPVYSDLRQRLNSVETQLASARAALAAKQPALLELQKRMDQVPGMVRDVTDMNRAREGLETRYKLLRERAMMADVSRATISTATPSVRVIDYAHPPMKPSWPRNLILVPSALGIGLLVGFAAALLIEMFSPRVNRDRLASRRDMPVYAVIALRHPAYPQLAGPLSRSSLPAAERLRRLS